MDQIQNRVLATIHGILSEGDALRALASDCQRAVPGLQHEDVFWGKHPVQVLFYESIRQSIHRYVWLELVDIVRRHPQDEITIVAHSYGSIAFVEAMRDMIVGLQACKVVFVGSIIPREFVWRGWKLSGIVASVLNVVRPFDLVVSRSVIVGGGYSGTAGFVGGAVDHYKSGGHSAYYPADVDDVISVINGTFDHKRSVNFAQWWRSLPRRTRLIHRVLRLTGILMQ